MKIRKYRIDRLAVDDGMVHTVAEMPERAEILHCGPDPSGEICVWAMVDPEAPTDVRNIHVVRTGGDAFRGRHISTWVAGSREWHAFDGGYGLRGRYRSPYGRPFLGMARGGNA